MVIKKNSEIWNIEGDNIFFYLKKNIDSKLLEYK